MSIDDTAASTVPAEDVLPGPPPPRAAKERSWRWIVAGVLATLVAAALLFVFLVRASTVGVDEYILAPGSATNTAPIVIVEGTETFPPKGEIAFTTVSIRRNITVWEWFMARYDDTSELVPAEQIDGSRSAEETRQVTQFQMDISQDTATLVALNYLGFEIVPEVEGAFVVQLVRDSPAEQVMQLGDLITEVNDIQIRSSEDLGEAIRALEPGAEVRVSLLRGDLDAGGNGSDPDAEPVDLTITLGQHPDIEGSGFLGVRIETPVRADAPFDVTLDVGRVRGPSAGLAFSLAILDVLTEGELTGGLHIATTGTINANGLVGAVGGVPQKIEAAKREGIDLFLVPPSEYADAVEAANGQLEIRCVQTFADAVLELETVGGNGVEAARSFGAPLPERSPNPIDPNDGFETCAELVGT